MQRVGTFLKWLILLPVIVVILLLAISNDQTITLHLNPFDIGDPVLKIDLALYAFAFALFAIGAVCGGIVAWSGQRKHRRRAEERREEVAYWQARAETADRGQPQGTALALRPGRG